MGHAPHAILAYGHELTDVDDFGGEPPAWYDEEEGWHTSATAHLLRRTGKVVDDTDYISDSQLLEFAGVQLIRYGDDNSETYLLAARSFETDWDGVLSVDQAVPDNAHERLTWAIETLGLNPDQTKPRWILAAYMPG